MGTVTGRLLAFPHTLCNPISIQRKRIEVQDDEPEV
jgi:hypothetical protein